MSKPLVMEISGSVYGSGTPERSGSRRPVLSLVWALNPETGKPVGRWIATGSELNLCACQRHDIGCQMRAGPDATESRHYALKPATFDPEDIEGCVVHPRSGLCSMTRGDAERSIELASEMREGNDQ